MPEYRLDADRMGDVIEWLLAYLMGGFLGMLIGGFVGEPLWGLWFGLSGMWILRSSVSYEYDPETKSSHWVIDTGPSLREEWLGLKPWLQKHLSKNGGDDGDV